MNTSSVFERVKKRKEWRNMFGAGFGESAL